MNFSRGRDGCRTAEHEESQYSVKGCEEKAQYYINIVQSIHNGSSVR